MKITVIGGGSYCWTPTLFRDFVCTPGLEGSEIVLEDINRKHLDALHKCCQAILAQLGKTHQFKLTVTTDQATALRGAHYVILTITTGGYESMAHDLRIPYKYGIYQPVGDTVGPGGISRALRNIPVVVGLAKNMERYCPNAWLLNITNPMTTLTRCVGRETSIRCVGLCHELYGALGMLQRLLGVKDWRTDFDCVSVGVNHLPWIIKLRHRGKDVFPLIRRKVKEIERLSARKAKLGTALDETLVGHNRVKFALFEAYGALPASGDRHIVEFFPYFTTREMRKGMAMGVELTTIEYRRTVWTPQWKKNVAEITSGKKNVKTQVSGESTSRVIAALAGLIPQWKDVLNLPNQGQVAELPRDVNVETLGFITHDACHGLPVGPIPPAVRAIIERHVTNQEMTVEAALTGDRSLVHQIFLNDPMCGSIRDFRDMEQMMDELLRANRQWLPRFFKK
jgi:alpha-galactosidase